MSIRVRSERERGMERRGEREREREKKIRFLESEASCGTKFCFDSKSVSD